MDLLSEALRTLYVRAAAYYRGEFAAPWGMTWEGGSASYHAVLEGRCLLEIAGGEGAPAQVWLEQGDFAVLPRGSRHVLSDSEGRVAPPVDRLVEQHRPGPDDVLRLPGDGPRATLVCGFIHFDDVVAHPLLEALPALMVVRRGEQASLPWLEHTLAFLDCESRDGRPGAEVAMGHLSSLLFIHAVRAYLNGMPAYAQGWLRTMRDPQLGPALAAIHAQPGAAWTVEALAERASMSRSAFSARFRELMGASPMQYVTRWRMYEAARLLRERSTPLVEVAARVGYESEAAFNRVFKRHVKQTPGRFRNARATVRAAKAETVLPA